MSEVDFEFDAAGSLFAVGANEAGDDVNGFGWGALRSVANALDYVTTGKRCSLFHYLKAEGRVAYLMDLPSRGDTCFAGYLQGRDADEIVLYDYSSDIDGPDVPWSVGQRQPTYIYRHVLRFSSDAAAKARAAPDPASPAEPTHG